MSYYKGVLTVGRKKRHQRERVIYTQGPNITTVMDVTRKIRYAKWQSIKEISREDYVKGVSSKNY